MKSKSVMAVAVVITMALLAGVSYAWFTDRATVQAASAEVGYLDIELVTAPEVDDEFAFDLVFPSSGDPQKITYTLKNKSNTAVYARLNVTSGLNAYLLKDEYIEDWILVLTDEQRSALASMTVDEKIADTVYFTRVNVSSLDDSEAAFAFGSNWTVSDGSSYLGYDTNGNIYFLLEPNASASNILSVGLTANAGNKFQYAVFSIDEAEALVTQVNATAFNNTFGINISTISK